MGEPNDSLPEFEKPPVTEVVLGVQFDALGGLRTAQIGMLWQEYRDHLPLTEEHAPLDPVIERFGSARRPAGSVQLQMLDAPPIPRCWFINSEGSELIQVQPDRFIRNWRKVGDKDEYPRYERRLRPAFSDEYARFVAFAEREKLGELVPNQCEVTYVNLIESCDVWREHAEAGKVVTFLSERYSGDFNAKPEDMRMGMRYIIPNEVGEPIGRLHLSLDPVFRLKDNMPMWRLTLTARGRPLGTGIEGVLRFLDLGRDWVVRVFTGTTTNEMHKVWRRRR